MSSRRRANNRGRKTNLDNLDEALSGMIRPQRDVKTVANPAEERRFTMHSSNNDSSSGSRGVFASSLKENPVDTTGGYATHTAEFEKHQVNYSDTKYIKP